MTELLDLIKDPDLKDLMGKAKSETSFDDIIKGLNDLNPWNAPDEKETNRKDFVENLEKCFSKKEWEKEGALEEEKALKDLLWELPGIADKDKDVFIPLLVDNILDNIKNVFPHNKINTDDVFKKKVLIALMICLPFMDYQQAFDGNLYDPRVIILGINPRFKADTFYDYGQKEEKKFMVDHMKEVYNTPIRDGNCPMLYKMNENDDENGEEIEPTDLHIAEDDYYYGKSGRFYTQKGINEKLKAQHRRLLLSKESKNPLAFLELFPYASTKETKWWDGEDLNHAFRLLKLLEWKEAVYNDLKVWATSNMNRISQISKPIRDKIELKSDELLYSQQWILCVLFWILKRNSFLAEEDEIKKLTIISRKSLKAFLPKLKRLVDSTGWQDVFLLTKHNPRSSSLSPNNLSLDIKINDPKCSSFLNDDNERNYKMGETLDNQAFRHLWGIEEQKS